MKFQIIIAGLACILWNTTMAQDAGRLYLEKNKLLGNCENLYFTGFEIELDSTYTKLDSILLFSQLPRVGKIHFKNRIEIPTVFTLTERAGYPQIMFYFKNDYLSFDQLEVHENYINFMIDEDPVVPVTQMDLEIIQLAKALLSEEEYWNKNDDRNCEDDVANKSYSLYCALRIASLEKEEYYNHRNATLQKVRHLIDLKFPDRKWQHRLMDFNNMNETAYQDIMDLLTEIETAFTVELSAKNE